MYSSKELKANNKAIYSILKKNRSIFQKLKGDTRYQLSPSLWNYLFSMNNHSSIHRLVKKHELPNPKDNKNYELLTLNNFKVILKDQKSIFSLSYFKVEEQVFSALRQSKIKKELVYIDFTGLYFLDFSFFKHFQKLSQVKTLCLHECGLIDIPQDLVNLPKHLIYLDLSCNYISSLPDELHWKNLEGLNLSHNALNVWPSCLNGNNFPELKGLIMSFNNLIKINQNIATFQNLISLDLSFTNLESFPLFISNSFGLKYLNLRGNIMLEEFNFNFIVLLSNLEYLDIGKAKTSEIDKHKIPASLEFIISHDTKNPGKITG